MKNDISLAISQARVEEERARSEVVTSPITSSAATNIKASFALTSCFVSEEEGVRALHNIRKIYNIYRGNDRGLTYTQFCQLLLASGLGEDAMPYQELFNHAALSDPGSSDPLSPSNISTLLSLEDFCYAIAVLGACMHVLILCIYTNIPIRVYPHQVVPSRPIPRLLLSPFPT
jgi:hypothetical protein